MNVVRPLPLSLAQESANYLYMIEHHHRLYIGRKNALDQIDNYVQGEERRPLVIHGAPGTGKTTLLVEWCRRYSACNHDDLLFPCFIGATADSLRVESLLRYLCRQLQERLPVAWLLHRR